MKQIINPSLKNLLDSYSIEIEYLPSIPESSIHIPPYINSLSHILITCRDINNSLDCYLGIGIKEGNSYYALLNPSYEILVDKEFLLWNSLMTKEDIIKYLYLILHSELLIDS